MSIFLNAWIKGIRSEDTKRIAKRTWFSTGEDNDDEKQNGDDDNELFLWNVWLTNGIKPYSSRDHCHRFSTSHISDMQPVEFTPRRICVEDFKMKLCSSDNHCNMVLHLNIFSF